MNISFWINIVDGFLIFSAIVLAILALVYTLNKIYNAGFKDGKKAETKNLSHQIFMRMERNEKRYLYLRRTTIKVVGKNGDKVDVTPELMDQVIDENIAVGNDYG